MKKSIFAVLAVTAIGSASAQSSVKIYGLIDEGFSASEKKVTTSGEKLTPSTTERASGINANNHSTSRIGFEVAEDLGNGTSVNSVIELGVDPNAEKIAPAMRQGYVGLKSNTFGQIAIGRQYTPLHNLLAHTDGVTGNNHIGTIYSNRNVVTDRANGVSYTYGTSGISGTIHYSANNNSEGLNLHGAGAGLNLRYGRAFGGLAYMQYTADSQITRESAYSATPAEGIQNQKSRNFGAVAGYDFGILKATYTYYQTRANSIQTYSELLTGRPLQGSENSKAQMHQLGLSANVTPNTEIYGTYMIGSGSGDMIDCLCNHIGYGEKVKSNGFQLGSRYNLSKRTNLYAIYGQQHHGAVGQGIDGTSNIDEKKFAIGLRHTF